MGTKAGFTALLCSLFLAVAGCAKSRAQAAPPLPPPEPLPLHDQVTGRTCGTPTNPGPGFTPPRAVYAKQPEYADVARKNKVTGTVYVVIDIGSDGLVENVCLARSLRKDLDESVIEAVRAWKFEPARKDGVPIPYTMTAEVSFNLY